MANPDITFIVGYPCPRCHAMLEARSGDTCGWLRCPECGRASLPPEHMRTSPPRRPPPKGGDVLFIGPSPEIEAGAGPSGMTPAFRRPRRSRHRRHPGGVARVAMATALILSLTGLVTSLLDRNALGAAILGFITLILFGALLMRAKGR